MSDRIRTQPPPFQALASDPPGEGEAPAFARGSALPNFAKFSSEATARTARVRPAAVQRRFRRYEPCSIHPSRPSTPIRPRGGPDLRNSRAHCRAKRVGARAHRPGCPPRFVGRRRALPRASGPLISLPVARDRPYRSSPALPHEYPPSHRPRPPRILPGVRRSPRRKSSLSAEFPRI